MSDTLKLSAARTCLAAGIVLCTAVAFERVPVWIGVAGVAALLLWAILRSGLEGQRNDWAGWLIFAIVSVLSVLILEFACRVVLPQPQLPPEIFEPHPRALYALRPGASVVQRFPQPGMAQAPEIPVRVSAQGWRGEDVPSPKPPDEIRVLCIGDSYTFGWGALEESTYPAQLEKLLEAAVPGRRIAVINGGTGGYGPWQERIVLEERGFPLEPDLVVLQIFPGNDFSDSLLRDATTTLEAFPVDSFDFAAAYRVIDHPVARANDWLRQHSRLFLEVESKLMGRWMLVRMYNRLRFVSLPGYRPVRPPGPRSWVVEPDLKDRYPALDEAWEQLVSDIRGIHEECASRGIPVAAFALPWVAGEERYQTEVERHGAQHYERDAAARMTEALLAGTVELPVPIVDTLRSHPDPVSLILPLDGHFNHAGNGLVAAQVADVLRPWLAKYATHD